MSENNYDKRDIVRRIGMLYAEGLKIAAYQVRDPGTNDFGAIQFHMTYNNTVMALMGAGEAKLFSTFVQKTLEENDGH